MKRSSSSTPFLGSLGKSPGVLLSLLDSTLRSSPRKRSPRKPAKPEETMGSSREKPAPATRHTSPSQPDTSVVEEPQQQEPQQQEEPQDLPPRAVTLSDVREYLAAAGEEEQAVVHADLAPDTREGGYQANFTPVRRELRSFPTQTPPQSFEMHRNPDGSVSLEHHAITIRIHGTLTQQD